MHKRCWSGYRTDGQKREKKKHKKNDRELKRISILIKDNTISNHIYYNKLSSSFSLIKDINEIMEITQRDTAGDDFNHEW